MGRAAGRVLLPAARLFCRTGGIPIEIKRKTLRRAEWWGGWEMRFAWGPFAGFGVQGVAALLRVDRVQVPLMDGDRMLCGAGYDWLQLAPQGERWWCTAFFRPDGQLEQLDPSESYKGTALEGTDAFQRQLKRFDIRAKGAYSDPVEKFFRTMESSVLFPEYIARAVRQGMEENNVLPKITATTTTIDSMDYRSVYSVPSEEDKKLMQVAEGASIPATEVKTKSNLVQLHKRGRMLVASYEAIRFQKLDLFSVTLRQIGAYIQKMHVQDAVDVLVNGDGNANAAEKLKIGTSPMSGTKGTLTYAQLVEFWSQFDPYTLNTMLVPGGTLVKLLSLSELQDAAAGLNFQGTGALATPLGAELVRSGCVTDGTIIGLDRRYALEMVQAGEVSVEYDKLIDRQLERAAITSISGFGKIMPEAAKVLVI